MVKQVDDNLDGHIDFQEFVRCLTPCLARRESDVEIRNAFREWNILKYGFIEAHELKAKLSEMSGEQVTDEEVQDMIRQVDMDGDGKINFEEFVKLMQEH